MKEFELYFVGKVMALSGFGTYVCVMELSHNGLRNNVSNSSILQGTFKPLRLYSQIPFHSPCHLFQSS